MLHAGVYSRLRHQAAINCYSWPGKKIENLGVWPFVNSNTSNNYFLASPRVDIVINTIMIMPYQGLDN